jgi:hypothetical protein
MTYWDQEHFLSAVFSQCHPVPDPSIGKRNSRVNLLHLSVIQWEITHAVLQIEEQDRDNIKIKLGRTDQGGTKIFFEHGSVKFFDQNDLPPKAYHGCRWWIFPHFIT